MTKHLFSKIALAIYLIIAIGLSVWAYDIYQDRNKDTPTVATNQDNNKNLESTEQGDSVSNENVSGNSGVEQNNTDDSNDPTAQSIPAINSPQKISAEVEVSGQVMANITQEHCSNDCQAFSSDLGLFEYCEQSCGISPIKNVSNCDNKKDIRKDYCLKDLAIIKKDISSCDSIKDANIKQSCRNHIEQAAIEDIQRQRPNEEPTY